MDINSWIDLPNVPHVGYVRSGEINYRLKILSMFSRVSKQFMHVLMVLYTRILRGLLSPAYDCGLSNVICFLLSPTRRALSLS